MSHLFMPLSLRGTTFRNRVFVSPMCQYSSRDGLPTHWHLVHLGSRAVGGAALVIAEATGVTPEGRISPADTGIWNDRQAEAWAPIARFIREQGAVPGIQLAHAGRKASTAVPWQGGAPLSVETGAWTTVAPSALPFAPDWHVPAALDLAGIVAVREAFVAAARRAGEAGFEVLELHMAHGYLLHEFLSPLTNRRADAYGGDAAGRMRLPLDIVRAVRGVWPAERPLFVRISASDWVDGGWTIEDSVRFARELKACGVDLVDCSSGGLVPQAEIPMAPGYQVPFAAAVREGAQIATGAVGLITDPHQAEEIVAGGAADAVLLARAMLGDPYWVLHAARALDAEIDYWPTQYLRAR